MFYMCFSVYVRLYVLGYMSIAVYIRRFDLGMCLPMSMYRIFCEYHCVFLGPMYEYVYLHEAHFMILYAHVLLCVYFRHVWCMCSKGKCMYLRYFWPNKQHSPKYTHAKFQHSIANYCTIQYKTVQYSTVLYCNVHYWVLQSATLSIPNPQWSADICFVVTMCNNSATLCYKVCHTK